MPRKRVKIARLPKGLTFQEHSGIAFQGSDTSVYAVPGYPGESIWLQRKAGTFLARRLDMIEVIECQFAKATPLILRGILVEYAINPGSVLKSKVHWLEKLYACAPDFTLEYLSFLRSELQQVPTKYKVAGFLRRDEAVIDSYGRRVALHTATDKDIAAHLNIPPSTVKKARQLLAAFDKDQVT